VRVSAKSDYALRALIEMASRTDGKAVSAEELGKQQEIPHGFLQAILADLRRAGIVMSQRGQSGGWRMGRAAESVSVADVIQAIDGPVAVTACSSSDDGACEQYAKCNVRDPLWRVRARILAALGECTIAELAADPPPAPTTHAAVLHTHL